MPAGVRYVITLDADTRLPRDAVRRLIGKMAHPLNRPRFDAGAGRVVAGYAVLQPRVTPSLPVGREGSLFQRVFSSMNGIDPYAAAVSDVYQDLFGEGSYAGKGIYDIDAFEAALAGRVPDSTLLSHDLFEGIFARAGLASDIEVVEEFPARYDVAARRHHRWARGDWQLLPWMLGAAACRHRGRSAIPAIGRWKMLDNLRRTLSAPACMLALLAGLALAARRRVGLDRLRPVDDPAADACSRSLLPSCRAAAGITPRSHLARARQRSAPGARAVGARRHVPGASGVADGRCDWAHAWCGCSSRHRHLLEWVTAAQASIGPRLDLLGFYRRWPAGSCIGVWRCGILCCRPRHVAWLAPLAALCGSPRRRLRAGSAAARTRRSDVRIGRRCAGAAADRTAHLAVLRDLRDGGRPHAAARQFPGGPGAGARPSDLADQSRAVSSVGGGRPRFRLDRNRSRRSSGWRRRWRPWPASQRFRGHFYNWYDTSDLRPLDPPYVSTVDSGNLAGHLITLANACREWSDASAHSRAAPRRDRRRARSCPREATTSCATDGARLTVTWHQLDDLSPRSRPACVGMPPHADDYRAHLADLAAQAEIMADIAIRIRERTRRWHRRGHVCSGRRAARRSIESSPTATSLRSPEAATVLSARLASLEATARTMALAMGFGFLLDPDRKLLSIGYLVTEGTLDPSCYDLLASEARLASFVAIAKGDVPARHWFRLGRAVTPVARGAALISWSGSMFEYLMPSLVMRAPAGKPARTDQSADRAAADRVRQDARPPVGHLGVRL